MRIIACFLVIFNHLPGYTLYQTATNLPKIWLCMLLTMVTRINVPLFLMISGALLLGKEGEHYSTIFTKRIARICCVILLFTGLLYIISKWNSLDQLSLWQYLRYVLAEPSKLGGGAYWYLYSYVGFLLMLPFLRRISGRMNEQDFLLLLLLHFIFSTLQPVANLLLKANGKEFITISKSFSQMMVFGTVKAIFYPIIGYFLDKRIKVEQLKKTHMLILLIMALSGILLSCGCTYYEGTHDEMVFTQNYVQLFDYLTAICVFITIKYYCIQYDGFSTHPNLVRVIGIIGSLTFGIYLFDPVLRRTLYDKLIVLLALDMKPMLSSLLWCISSMCIGGLITTCLKRLPWVQKLF